MPTWTLYILECSDHSLYTGITTDLDKRLKRHNEGKASKYTRSKRPVKLVYEEVFRDGTAARKREAAIKALSRQDKLNLI
jgi:putative endonuclease